MKKLLVFSMVSMVLLSCIQTKEIRIKNRESRKIQKQFNIPQDVKFRKPFSNK